jgi:hypothetical protein
VANSALNESILASVKDSLRKVISMNESLADADYNTYLDFARDVYSALSGVCYKYCEFGLSDLDIVNALDDFKDKFFEEKEDALTENFDLYILTSNKEEKKLKSSKKITPIKKMVDDFVSNPSKLDDIGATEMFVLDGNKSTNNELFIFSNDGEKWEVIHDKMPSQYSSEYADNLLNRVWYSLTNSLPENFSYSAEPSLKDALLKTKKGIYLIDGEEAGILFDDNGDARIRMTLNKDNQVIEARRNWIKKVAEHFGLEAVPSGDRSYEIVIKDQAKYFEE